MGNLSHDTCDCCVSPQCTGKSDAVRSAPSLATFAGLFCCPCWWKSCLNRKWNGCYVDLYSCFFFSKWEKLDVSLGLLTCFSSLFFLPQQVINSEMWFTSMSETAPSSEDTKRWSLPLKILTYLRSSCCFFTQITMKWMACVCKAQECCTLPSIL